MSRIASKGIAPRWAAAALALTCVWPLAVSAAFAAPPAVGRVRLEQVQMAFIGSATKGTGSLVYKGRSYPLEVGGLGVGGIGASTVVATGNVYQLTRAQDIEGVYGQVRVGWALAERGSGQLWLENDKGVVLRLATRRKGLMLALGADAVRIQLR
jgi:hypothetical protein